MRKTETKRTEEMTKDNKKQIKRRKEGNRFPNCLNIDKKKNDDS